MISKDTKLEIEIQVNQKTAGCNGKTATVEIPKFIAFNKKSIEIPKERCTTPGKSKY